MSELDVLLVAVALDAFVFADFVARSRFECCFQHI